MNKKVFNVVLLLAILFSCLFILTGCEKDVKFTYEELQQKCDINVYEHKPSGTAPVEGTAEYKEYFINYSESKLYVCKIKREIDTKHDANKLELLKTEEFNTDANKLKELKDFIDEEHSGGIVEGGTRYTIQKKGQEVGEISNASQFEKIIKEITGK